MIIAILIGIVSVLLIIGMISSLINNPIPSNDPIPNDKRKKITPDLFNDLLRNSQYDRLLAKKEAYLKAFEKKEEYYALNRLYNKFAPLYRDYVTQTLCAPLRLTKPVSPYTAAYFGTRIGGMAVGMVAAQNAIEKEKAYQKNVDDVIEAEINRGNAYDKVEYCYQSIVAILSQDKYTYNNWYNEKQLIKAELDKKYKT